jgi:ATP-dependent RNA helicase DDX24/MAK5
MLTCRLSDASVDPDTPYHVPKKGKGNNLGTRKTSGVALINLRNELKALLAEPLMARGVSAKYPTSGSRVIIDELLKSASQLDDYFHLADA